MSSTNSSAETEPQRKLFRDDVLGNGYGLEVEPRFKRDLKNYSAETVSEVWTRLRAFFRSLVLREPPPMTLNAKKKMILVGGKQYLAWVIEIAFDVRAGLDIADRQVTLFRVGPHQGNDRIYPRSR